MTDQMSSWKFSATWVKYGSDKSRRNFTEIHLATCLHLDAACIHLDPFASKDEFDTVSLAPPQTLASATTMHELVAPQQQSPLKSQQIFGSWK